MSKELVDGYYRLLDPCGGNLVGTREHSKLIDRN